MWCLTCDTVIEIQHVAHTTDCFVNPKHSTVPGSVWPFFFHRKSLGQFLFLFFSTSTCPFDASTSLVVRHWNQCTVWSGEHVREEPSPSPVVGILSHRKTGREHGEQNVHLACSPPRPYNMWVRVQKSLNGAYRCHSLQNRTNTKHCYATATLGDVIRTWRKSGTKKKEDILLKYKK